MLSRKGGGSTGQPLNRLRGVISGVCAFPRLSCLSVADSGLCVSRESWLPVALGTWRLRYLDLQT